MKHLIANVLAFLLFSVPLLAGDITANGIYQKDLHTFLTNTTSLVNELRTDHATFRTAVTGNETAVEELLDNVTSLNVTASMNRTAVVELLDNVTSLNVTASENRTAIVELIDDHATFKAVVDELAADHATFITAWNTFLVKLDADLADVANASTDYAASVTTPSALANSAPATLTATDPTANKGEPSSSDPTVNKGEPTSSDPASAPAAVSASALSLSGL